MVGTLRQVWGQQYHRDDGAVHWRAREDIPPSAIFISSPFDGDAHYARKRTTQWAGYKVHVAETCDVELPHLVTDVGTTAGPTDDGAATPLIHQALQGRGLLPSVHLVDTGFLDAEMLVTNWDEYGVELLGPTHGDHHGQARGGEGFDAQHFPLDCDQQQATCRAGHTRLSWTPGDRQPHERPNQDQVLEHGPPPLFRRPHEPTDGYFQEGIKRSSDPVLAERTQQPSHCQNAPP
jgi:transposase